MLQSELIKALQDIVDGRGRCQTCKADATGAGAGVTACDCSRPTWEPVPAEERAQAIIDRLTTGERASETAPIVDDQSPITQAEMFAMFGNEMPLAAVQLVWLASDGETVGSVRAKLREIARQEGEKKR